MTTRRPTITKAAVTRAVRGAQDAGLEISRVEVDAVTGRIIVIAGKPSEAPGNDLDQWMAKNARVAERN